MRGVGDLDISVRSGRSYVSAASSKVRAAELAGGLGPATVRHPCDAHAAHPRLGSRAPRRRAPTVALARYVAGPPARASAQRRLAAAAAGGVASRLLPLAASSAAPACPDITLPPAPPLHGIPRQVTQQVDIADDEPPLSVREALGEPRGAGSAAGAHPDSAALRTGGAGVGGEAPV
jgi:hypothetical protein